MFAALTKLIQDIKTAWQEFTEKVRAIWADIKKRVSIKRSATKVQWPQLKLVKPLKSQVLNNRPKQIRARNRC